MPIGRKGLMMLACGPPRQMHLSTEPRVGSARSWLTIGLICIFRFVLRLDAGARGRV